MRTDITLQNDLDRELDDGEQILWSARPDPARVARQYILMFVFGIPFTLFALFWMGMTSMITGLMPGEFTPFKLFPLFGLPFVLVGLGLLSSPFWAYRKAKSGAYAITNRRIIIIEGGSSRSVKSYVKRDVQQIERREHSNGTGDLIFAREYVRGSKGRVNTREIGFFGIPRAREVEHLLRGLIDPGH
jgi:hypothetical protein